MFSHRGEYTLIERDHEVVSPLFTPYSDFFPAGFLAYRYLSPTRADCCCWRLFPFFLPLSHARSLGPPASALACVCIYRARGAHRFSAAVTPGKHETRRETDGHRALVTRRFETQGKVAAFSRGSGSDLKFARLGRTPRLSRHTYTNKHARVSRPGEQAHLRRTFYLFRTFYLCPHRTFYVLRSLSRPHGQVARAAISFSLSRSLPLYILLAQLLFVEPTLLPTRRLLLLLLVRLTLTREKRCRSVYRRRPNSRANNATGCSFSSAMP